MDMLFQASCLACTANSSLRRGCASRAFQCACKTQPELILCLVDASDMEPCMTRVSRAAAHCSRTEQGRAARQGCSSAPLSGGHLDGLAPQ